MSSPLTKIFKNGAMYMAVTFKKSTLVAHAPTKEWVMSRFSRFTEEKKRETVKRTQRQTLSVR